MDKKPSFLIVESDKKVSLNLENSIIKYDENVIVTKLNSAEEAILKLNEGFDCVIVSYELPTISGLSLCEYIKAKNFNIPTILYTRKNQTAVSSQAAKFGVHEYIPCIKDVYEYFPHILYNVFYRKLYYDQTKHLKLFKDSLYSLSEIMGSNTLIDNILNQSLKLTADVLNADGGSLMLLDRKEKELEIKAVTGTTKAEFIGSRLKVGERISGKAAEKEEAILIDGSIKKDDRFKEIEKYEEIESAMSVPIIYKDKLIGIINLKRISQKNKFSPDDIKIATVFAQNAAVIIENSDINNRYLKAMDYIDGIITRINDSFVVLDKYGRIRTVNEKFLFDTGYVQEELIGKYLTDLEDTNNANNFLNKEYIDTLINTDEVRIENIEILSKNRNKLIYKANIAIIRLKSSQINNEEKNDPEINVLGIIIMMKQIDELSKTKEQLFKIIKNVSITEVIIPTFSEILNQISDIKNISDDLAVKITEENPIHEKFNNIKSNIDSSLDTLKILSSLIFPKQETSEIIYPINVIDNVLKMLYHQFHLDGIRIEKEYLSAGAIRFNESEFSISILFLLNFSRDSMPVGGTIKIKVEEVLSEEKKIIKITLTDTGSGMSEIEKLRIFTPFCITEKVSSGLVLYNAKEIIKKNEGNIIFDSNIGKGSSFIISLPLVM